MTTIDTAAPVLGSVQEALDAASLVAADIAAGAVQREIDGVLPTEPLARIVVVVIGVLLPETQLTQYTPDFAVLFATGVTAAAAEATRCMHSGESTTAVRWC